jgi:uncharacterized protein YbaP (TraB family)
MKRQIFGFLLAFVAASAAAQTASNPGWLWKISGNGLAQNSYLFGTCHGDGISFTDEEIYGSFTGLTDALDEAKAVFFETNMGSKEISEEEKEEMERNVLEHEPSLALFVPDKDPLLFYRRIADLGCSMLAKAGMLFFEINRRFGKEVVKMLQEMGYRDVELRQDMFGNDRMVKAIKPQ